MEKKCIDIEGISKAGPYSHAVEVGEMLFLSGTVPVDPKTGEAVRGDIKRATARVLENIKMILEGAGSSLDNVVKAGVFLTDMADFSDMNEVYKTYFTSEQPARTCVAVKQLPGNFEVEMDIIAIK
ncbi:MAG: Rid family detoxifying hydrolase [Bacillota bacterium]|nr:Rid family detoxifying hydrolase [Bacillota bacterium]